MQHISRVIVPVFVLSLGLFTSSVRADDEVGLKMAEGHWIFDVHVQIPMQAKPSAQRLQTCVTEEPITIETLMPWAESQGCKVRGAKQIENGLSWKLRCKLNGQRSRGSGEFTAVGERGEGKARVNFEMGGRRVSIVTTWDARRTGECPTKTQDDSPALQSEADDEDDE